MVNKTPTNHNLTSFNLSHGTPHNLPVNRPLRHTAAPTTLMPYLVCGIGEDILIRLIYELPRLSLDWCADRRQRDGTEELRLDNFPQLQINREASVSDRGPDEKWRRARRKARK